VISLCRGTTAILEIPFLGIILFHSSQLVVSYKYRQRRLFILLQGIIIIIIITTTIAYVSPTVIATERTLFSTYPPPNQRGVTLHHDCNSAAAG